MTCERVTAPSAAPRTTVAPGAPLQAVSPVISWATIVETVTAAMYPVLPRATPATIDHSVRRRSRASSDGALVTGRSVGTAG